MGVLANCRCMTFGCMVGFCLLLGGVGGTTTVTATAGQDVTLPCSYDAAYYGRLALCWGRGPIPRRGCNNEVLQADSRSVVSRQSMRYRLMGNLNRGDVSLTILQVQLSESGIYGCRVDIPGWFNDHKHEMTLRVVAGRPHPAKLEAREVTEKTITIRWTPGPDGGSSITGYRINIKSKTSSWDTATTVKILNTLQPQVTLIDMRPHSSYDIRMFAVNSVGLSQASNVVTVTTREAAPSGAPLDVQLEALTPRSIKVTWKPPKMELRNGVLRDYKISYREYDSTSRRFKEWYHQRVRATGGLESTVLNNLRPATQYNVEIRASTMAGMGPAFSAPLFSTLAEVPPDPPVLELLKVNDKMVSFRWTAGFDGRAPISSYDMEYKVENTSWDTATKVKIINPLQPQVTLIDMRPHSSYDIRMFAVNSVGLSQASNVVKVTTREAAPSGPPLDIQLEALTPRSIKVTWKPPKMELRNGVLRDYKISYSEYDSASRRFKEWYHQRVRATGGLESTVLNNLRPATQYNVEIRASTMAGMGPAFSAPLFSTLAEVPPDPPVLELLEVNDTMVSFRWTAGFDGNAPISSYDMEYKVENTSWDTATMVKIINPLQPQVTLIDMRPHSSYDIRMFAVNSVGLSQASNVVTVTTREAAPSGPPLDIQLEALTPRSIKVTWKPPKMELRNGVLHDYKISYSEYDSASQQFKEWYHQRVRATGGLESTVLNNLRPATQYIVEIRASTMAGMGPAFSAPLFSTLAEVPPDPPVLELLEVNDTMVSFCWTAGFDGRAPISSYDMEYKVENTSWDTATTVKIINPLQPQVTLIDMRPHSSYDIRMFAVNSVGLSQASNDVTVTTREAAPSGPPLDIQLEALTPRSIKVTWKPPKMELRNGVLHDYKISYREYDSASQQFKEWYHQRVRATGGLESTVLNNLRPATQYIVEIRASTMAGMGPAFSAPLFSTLAEVPPDPPVLELLEVNDTMVSFRWTAGFDGRAPISSYDMEYKVENTSWDTATTFKIINPLQPQVTLIDMRPHSSYDIRMFAVNSVGLSQASNVVTVTTREAAPSGPPLDIQLEALTPRSIKVTWKPPKMELRNGVLHDYKISYSEYDSASQQFKEWYHQRVRATGGLESTVLNNLRPATQYIVEIRASTMAGMGPAFSAPLFSTLAEVPPDPPVLELLEVNDTMVSFCWTAGFDGRAPISSYDMEYKVENTSWDTATTVKIINPLQPQVTLIDMRPHSSYDIRMFAVNSVGLSQASNDVTVTTREAAPSGPPLDIQLEALTPRSIKVTWKPPKMELRNGVLHDYKISYREYDSASQQFKEWYHQRVRATGGLESTVLNNLRPATQYIVEIRASTMAGMGPAFSAPLFSTLAEVPPDPPVLELLEVNDTMVSFRWTAGFDGRAPISSYDMEYKVENTSWDTATTFKIINPLQPQVTLIDMRPHSSYDIRMFAVNSVGLSQASNVVTVTTREAAPSGPPLDIQLEALTPRSIKVTWKPPKMELRNGVLHDYKISYSEYDSASQQFKEWYHQRVRATGGLESTVLNNLRPATQYIVEIRASTMAGMGPAFSAPLFSTLAEVPPDPPVLELLEVNDTMVSFCWTAGFDGRAPISSYDMEYKVENTSWDTATTVKIINPLQPQVTLIDMRPHSSYDIRMFAVNSVGLSQASNDVTVTTREAAPSGPPLDIQLEALTPRSIKVTWKPPKMELRNGVLHDYKISYREYDSASQQFKEWYHQRVRATGGLESTVLNNLRPATQYIVEIRASTMAGMGPAFSAPLFSTLAEVPPDPPVLELLEVNDTMHPGILATTFKIINPLQPQVTLIDMRPHSSYDIRMFAVNSAPSGPPLDIQLEALTPRSIKVTWKPPKMELRNGVLHDYKISYSEYDSASQQFKEWYHQRVRATGRLGEHRVK
ncbi:Protein sidekick [Merluccius polli]|uniref:Protein sidekick n=1 Tax=Merluccius polli TaxID=89951 RepID=A0AA47MI63_MERPO|nr:Protein sidekick [Merluccius polli]